jgi:arylsulfatase A-like enzyme
MKSNGLLRIVSSLVVTLTCVSAATAQETPPSKNPFDKTVRVAEHLEPAIPRAAQEKVAKEKLTALKAKKGRAPNILIIVVDDMGWGDIGVNGGGVAVGAPTPNIDGLARGGLNLTSCYAQSTCTPTRAALMTGRFPARTGLTRPLMAGEKMVVNPWADEEPAAKLLSAAGYKTALSGKWHVGEPEGCRPHEVGYDEYLGILAVNSEITQSIDERLYPDLVLRPERLAALRKLVLPIITAGEKGKPARTVLEYKTIEEVGNSDQIFADYSVDFIKRSAAEKKPFYLIHAFSKVHNDNYPGPGYKGKSPAGFPYKDAIVEVDDIVGRLIKTLIETDQAENTLVFFTSDNGANEDTWPDGGYNPWRGGKGSTWEGGVRVPGIAYWPGMIAPRPASDGLFDLMDLFNTSLAVAGETKRISDKRYVDGIDQTGFLLADDGQSARQCVFMYAEKEMTAIRWMEYKVHTKVYQSAGPMKNLDESVLSKAVWPWVYNLYMDPKEQRSTGHRYFEWGLTAVVSFMTDHGKTYNKYPMKSLGLELPK